MSVALFALAAWPILLVPVPPLQDLPNHLASAFAVAHPAQYPEYVSNGLFKTNAAAYAWLRVLGGPLGLRLAGKTFVLFVVAVGAFVYPHAIWRLGGAKRLRSAALLAWPMAHNWFVCMGMLDYALGVALGIECLVQLAALAERPRAAPALFATLLAIAVWYTHVFALAVVGLLVVVHVARQGRPTEILPKKAAALRLLPPLVPAVAISAWSVLTQLRGETHVGERTFVFVSPWDILYNAWAEWLWAFTKLEIATLLVAIVLAVFLLRYVRETPTFFSPLAVGVLVACYVFTPYDAANWFHVSSRFLPFVWMAALLRVPEKVPRWLAGLLGAAAVSYSVGMGVDYARLSRDWARFTSAEAAVPRDAKLLPLVFSQKGRYGDNTWPMLHAWGFYVIDRGTSAPLLFAHSPSFAVSYRKQPPLRFHQLYLEVLPQGLRDPKHFCRAVRGEGVIPDDCAAEYRAAWQEFWDDATPRFDHVLMFEPPEAVREALPTGYHVVFDRDGVVVLERLPPRAQ